MYVQQTNLFACHFVAYLVEVVMASFVQCGIVSLLVYACVVGGIQEATYVCLSHSVAS